MRPDERTRTDIAKPAGAGGLQLGRRDAQNAHDGALRSRREVAAVAGDAKNHPFPAFAVVVMAPFDVMQNPPASAGRPVGVRKRPRFHVTAKARARRRGGRGGAAKRKSSVRKTPARSPRAVGSSPGGKRAKDSK